MVSGARVVLVRGKGKGVALVRGKGGRACAEACESGVVLARQVAAGVQMENAASRTNCVETHKYTSHANGSLQRRVRCPLTRRRANSGIFPQRRARCPITRRRANSRCPLTRRRANSGIFPQRRDSLQCVVDSSNVRDAVRRGACARYLSAQSHGATTQTAIT